ncbi:hypothetical protein [Pseudomonas aeruginosa]|uniref:hypothetical protein n=1 Tax=Pseudomonas aeruginosa TaxID=287 RepID=UPI00070E7B67|nr:hypothetical protein [Pseudomonas aeruginosa]
MTAEHVLAFAEQHRAPEEYIYLLVDGLGECSKENRLSIPSLTQALGDDHIARVPRPDLAHTPDACPVLFQLAAPGETPSPEHLRRSARYALDDVAYNKRYVCGWLTSPEPLEAVSRHIATQCYFTAPGGGRPMSPWFEPLRLELLAAALGEQLGGVLMPITRWLCPTSWGSLAILHSTAGLPDAALPDRARETQRLAPLINDFLGAWRHALERPVPYAPWRWNGTSPLPPQAGTHAYRLTRDAHQRGLGDSRDVIALSLHRVFIHPHLPQHPDVQRDIALAAAGTARLQARFETYSDADWKRIAASLPRAENYT